MSNISETQLRYLPSAFQNDFRLHDVIIPASSDEFIPGIADRKIYQLALHCHERFERSTYTDKAEIISEIFLKSKQWSPPAR